MKTKRNLRRKFLIDKRFQLGVAGTLAAIQLLTFLAAFLAASWLYLFVLDRRMVCSHNAAFLSHLGVASAIGIALLVYWCIRRTHAIAGPIYKTRQLLQAAAGGELPGWPVRFRKRDCFQNLAEDLNACLDYIGNLQAERQNLLLALKDLQAATYLEEPADQEIKRRLKETITCIEGGTV
jgi:hypothetical protein